MRVISGQARGHKLKAPEGKNTRPTTDRVKESLFNIIAFDLEGCRFLDLFSGSGAIGIEALSRGAQKAVFVDSSNECGEIIRFNLNHTKFLDQAEIINKDALSAISYLAKKGERFDIIFMDPPYQEGLYEPVLHALASAELLDEGGYIIAEHACKVPVPAVRGFRAVREKDYKTTAMTFMVSEE